MTTKRRAVYAWTPDGAVRRISPPGGYFWHASVHPSGGTAVFWGADDGPPRIWLADIERGTCEPLTPGDVGASMAAFTPDGSRIVYCAHLEGSGTAQPMAEMVVDGGAAPRPSTVVNLRSMAPDGSDVREISSGPFQDHRPAVSPDGATVVFVSTRGDGPLGLWLVPADGSADPTVLLAGAFVYRPVFDWTGDAVYYIHIGSDRHQIHRIRTAGGDPEPVANDDAGDTHGPFPDPGGDRLVVHSTREGHYRLYELPLDGTPMRRLGPPGWDDRRPYAHGTRAEDGTITFDAAPED